MRKICVAVIIWSLCNVGMSLACTSMLITPGASDDGSSMISYHADSHMLYGELYFLPAKDNLSGTMRVIYEWDTGKKLGQIPEVPHTFQVIGNMNEHQLAISETTFGGREELRDTCALMDYGSLIYIALQRAKNAREAISIMTKLVAEYGYYSSGESFSIADPSEVWIMEMIGKGVGNKGALWVARRVPDGYICAHANHSRIHKFPLSDKKNCLYSKDVIAFARKKGYFKGKDIDFSFSEAYAPAGFDQIRFCEARVWSIFRRIAPSMKWPVETIDGSNLNTRLPLWIKPDRPISMKDAFALMRDHFEGTPLDMTEDIGAGPFRLPYRWRPLTWTVDSVTYCNERAISTQQTAFSFVSQSRKFLPNPIGGILWFGVDDSYSTVYTPIYCCTKKAPYTFEQGNGNLFSYSNDAAFWAFNRVSNFAYLRYSDMIQDIQMLQHALEDSFLIRQPFVEKEAKILYAEEPHKAVEFLSNYSIAYANAVVDRWKKLFEELLVKYIDGNIKPSPGILQQPGYPEDWYRLIIHQTESRYLIKK